MRRERQHLFTHQLEAHTIHPTTMVCVFVMQFTAMTPHHWEELRLMIGKEYVIHDPELIQDYSHDEFPNPPWKRLPDVVVKPGSAEEISKIVKWANQHHIPVTPRGGGTGLAGGCIPIYGGIVLALDRLNRVLEIDTANLMATAEAGVTLEQFFQAIEPAGLFFPPHPGDESATIGGVIATNAGGSRAVKYGVIRNFIRGIEVVLPTGEIIQIGGKVIKNSTGYSLLHLMIGSEGTLGIVTKATIQLYPPPGHTCSLVVPFESLQDAIKAVPDILRSKVIPLAVEFMEMGPLELAQHHIHKTWPCTKGNAHLLIMLDAAEDEELMRLAEKMSEICEQHQALDVFVAQDASKQRQILELRSCLYEALREHMVEGLDLTVPRAAIADLVRDVHQLEEKYHTWCPCYGHAADGNIHSHIMNAAWENGQWNPIPNWQETYPAIRKEMHFLALRYQGVISGEHGMGIAKKEYIAQYLGSAQLQVMKMIKHAMDPQGILNPGKIWQED